jgi:biopolymer transport protein ExbD
MRALTLAPLLALSALIGCSPKAAAALAACEGGDADACEIVAARYFLGEGVPRDENMGGLFTGRAAQLRGAACVGGDKAACDKILVRNGPLPMAAAPPAAAPLDLPRASSGDVQLVFSVELPDAKSTFVNGKAVADDAALLAVAKKQVVDQPDTRAVIRAEQSVPHGRVIAVLDTLKQAGVSKIAFGVSPAASAVPR